MTSDNNTVFPQFVDPYFNVLQRRIRRGARHADLHAAFAAGRLPHPGPGNPADQHYTGSPAIDRGAALGDVPVLGPPGVQTITNLGNDIDGEIRPFDEPLVTDNPSAVDIGADEFRRIVLP